MIYLEITTSTTTSTTTTTTTSGPKNNCKHFAIPVAFSLTPLDPIQELDSNGALVLKSIQLYSQLLIQLRI